MRLYLKPRLHYQLDRRKSAKQKIYETLTTDQLIVKRYIYDGRIVQL